MKNKMTAWLLLSFILLINCTTTSTVFRGAPGTNDQLTDREIEKFVSDVRHSAGNPDSHYLLATYYLKRGMYKEAVVEFKKVISIDPGHAKAYNGIGICYDRLGTPERAAGFYKKALEINPELYYVHNNLGYSYLLRKKYDSAIAALRKAKQLNNENTLIRNNLSLAYAEKGSLKETADDSIHDGDSAEAYDKTASLLREDVTRNEAGGLKPEKPSPEKGEVLPDSGNAEEETAERSETIEEGKHASYNPGYQKATSHNSKKEKTDPPAVAELSGDASSVEVVSKNTNVYNIKRNAEIEISNGNGVNGMAGRIGKYLGIKGFDVVRLTNADNFNHSETILYYRKGYLHKAYEVAKQIPGYQNMEKTDNFDRAQIKIKVLIGRDIVKNDPLFAEVVKK